MLSVAVGVSLAPGVKFNFRDAVEGVDEEGTGCKAGAAGSGTTVDPAKGPPTPLRRSFSCGARFGPSCTVTATERESTRVRLCIACFGMDMPLPGRRLFFSGGRRGAPPGPSMAWRAVMCVSRVAKQQSALGEAAFRS